MKPARSLAISDPDDRSADLSPRIAIRKPGREDGAAVWKMVADSATLDTNSMYCNLLQCSHFATTCAIAEMEGEMVGWMSGYIPPEEPDTYFVWQICTAERARGKGIARQLISSVLARPVCHAVTRLQTTITSNNAPSWALFGAMAGMLEADLTRAVHFRRDTHFDGRHDTEYLVTIGPFAREALPERRVA